MGGRSFLVGIAVATLLVGVPTSSVAQLFGTGSPPTRDASKEEVRQAELTLEERLARLERQVDSQTLVDILMRLDSLQEELQGLRGDAELLAHDIDGLKKRQRDLYLDIDRRMRDMELSGADRTAPGGQASTSPSRPADGATIPSAAPPVVAAVENNQAPQAGVDLGLQEQASYQKAFDLLKQRDYEQAIAAFRGFLAQYGQGSYSSNAQYWLGEAYYVTRQFQQAADEFQKVIKDFPDSAKNPDALLKMGFAYYEMSNWAEARKALNEAVNRYPTSSAARLANNRLQKMRIEGH